MKGNEENNMKGNKKKGNERNKRKEMNELTLSVNKCTNEWLTVDRSK